jgi:hypothetical protein
VAQVPLAEDDDMVETFPPQAFPLEEALARLNKDSRV